MTQSPPSNQPQSLPAIWSDIVLWVVILVMIGAAGFWLYFNDTNQRQTISLPFRDANEMTVGANVRMMGTEIGYVEDIQLKDGHVDVRIKTEAGMVPIPPGSRATILFTGLGGAKSVEIDPPREFNLLDYRTLSNRHHLSDTGIIVEEPIRQKDNNKYMVDIAESLRDGARNFYKVFGQGSVQQTSKNVRLSTIRTQKAINALKQTNKEFDASLNAYKQIQPHFFTMLTQLNHNTAMVADLLNQKLVGPTAYDLVYTLSITFENLTEKLDQFSSNNGFDNIENQALGAKQSLEYVNAQHPSVSQQVKQTVSHTHVQLGRVKQELNTANKKIDHLNLPATLKRILWMLESINQQIKWF